jgi:hypothetical protein
MIGQRKNSGILIGQRKQHANGDGRPDMFNGSVRNASLIGQRKKSGILIGQRKQHASVDGRPDRFNRSVRNASDWSADKVRDWLG